MIPTVDPHIMIEEQREGYVRYRNTLTGRRWEIHGTCDRRGDCLIGAVIDVRGKPTEVRDHAHIKTLQRRIGRRRLDSEMDVPVTPEFVYKGLCCGADLLTAVELEPDN